MLAEDFGYQLSSVPASAMTPAVQEEVDKALENSAARTTRNKGAETFSFAVLLALTIVFTVETANVVVLVIGLVVSGLLASAAGKPSPSSKAAAERLREMTPSVLSGRWQVWPCRMEAVQGQPRRRVMLLDPQGTPAVTFLSAVPDDAWMKMTDGRGLVWFVGDLRFGGLVALPGGSPVWWSDSPVVTPPAAPSKGGARLAFEQELAQQAVKFVFDQWLR